jgi:hypothetical protein
MPQMIGATPQARGEDEREQLRLVADFRDGDQERGGEEGFQPGADGRESGRTGTFRPAPLG